MYRVHIFIAGSNARHLRITGGIPDAVFKAVNADCTSWSTPSSSPHWKTLLITTDSFGECMRSEVCSVEVQTREMSLGQWTRGSVKYKYGER